MKIIQPYAHIISMVDGIAMLKFIESIGRASHRSEDRQTDDSYDRFIRTVVMSHGDLSIIEHCSVTVEMVVDRGITHEVVRHRVGSYTQESTRFVNYGKEEHEPEFVVPEGMTAAVDSAWQYAIATGSGVYRAMLLKGISPQLARSVLPNALASKLIITYNLRNWRHFFIMRCSKEAHPQMRQVTVPLLAEFQAAVPILFEDIQPGMKQSEAMRLLR